MNKKLKAILISVIVIVTGGFMTYKYINKETDDISNSKPIASFTLTELLEKSNKDTLALSKLKDKLIAVSGMVKSVSLEDSSMTIEMGDSISSSSVILQIDQRHIAACKSISENQLVNLKGMLRSFSIDTAELGFGNTIELNYCCLNK